MSYITPGVYLEKSGERTASRINSFTTKRKRFPPAGVTISGYLVRHLLSDMEPPSSELHDRWDQDLGEAIPIFPGSPDPEHEQAEYFISGTDPNATQDGTRWDQLLLLEEE